MITGVPNAESFGSHPFVFRKQASYIYIINNLALKNSSVHTLYKDLREVTIGACACDC